MPGYGDVTAWDFLKKLYEVSGIKAFFDAAALHPYAKDLTQFKQEIQRVRNVIKGHSDAATPLWISELAWGSAPPDSHGINKGPDGAGADARPRPSSWCSPTGPPGTSSTCSGTTGAIRSTPGRRAASAPAPGCCNFNRTPKPALKAFKDFTTEKVTPKATITAGPAAGEHDR